MSTLLQNYVGGQHIKIKVTINNDSVLQTKILCRQKRSGVISRGEGVLLYVSYIGMCRCAL